MLFENIILVIMCLSPFCVFVSTLCKNIDTISKERDHFGLSKATIYALIACATVAIVILLFNNFFPSLSDNKLTYILMAQAAIYVIVLDSSTCRWLGSPKDSKDHETYKAGN